MSQNKDVDVLRLMELLFLQRAFCAALSQSLIHVNVARAPDNKEFCASSYGAAPLDGREEGDAPCFLSRRDLKPSPICSAVWDAMDSVLKKGSRKFVMSWRPPTSFTLRSILRSTTIALYGTAGLPFTPQYAPLRGRLTSMVALH